MKQVIVIAAVVVLACRSGGAVVIDVGFHALLPNTAGQQIVIRVSGGEQVTGFNLRAQLGDGLGPQDEPVFAGVSFAGGIWSAYPYWVVGGPVEGAEQFAQASVLFTQSGQSVAADGSLVTLSIDTTGFPGHAVFPLRLSATQIGVDSDFIVQGGGSLAPTIYDGVICIGTLPGDTNNDGVVDAADYIALKRNFGMTSGAQWLDGDFSGDHQVNWTDLQILMSNFGTRTLPTPSPTATPEPATLVILAMGGLAVMRRRRR
jgi:hypothetical protein